MMRSPILRLVVITTLLRLAFAAATGLGVDESYMVTAGRGLSFGYFDHPPASWWLSWGGAHLFGTEAPLAVRLPFILLFALSQGLMAGVTGRLVNGRAAFWAVVAFNLSPVFGVTTGTWILPDGPLDTALLGAAYCLMRALPSAPQRAHGWWAGAGLCAGLALFSKYSAILVIGGGCLFILFHAPSRQWLRRPHPYGAGLLALTVFSPVLLWNAAHGWTSFAFQGDRAMGLRFHPLAPIATLGGEALFVLPWLWAPMMILLIRAARPGVPWQERLLAALAAPPIALFALIAAWSSQRVLYHWAAPGYLFLFPLLGRAIADHEHRRWIMRSLAGTAAAVALSLLVIAAQIQSGLLSTPLVALMRTDPTPEGLDWISVRTDLQSRGLLPEQSVVAALNWREAGKFGYALGPGVTPLCLNVDERQFGFAHPLPQFAGQDAIVLSMLPADQAARLTASWFGTVELLADSAIRLNGQTLARVTVLRGRNLIAHRG